MIKIAVFCFFFFTMHLFSQSNFERILNGKITLSNDDDDRFFISNLANKKNAITQKEGLFAIQASVGDTLSITSIRYRSKKIKLENNDFLSIPFTIELEPLMQTLKEVVVVKNKKFDASSMKFTDKKVKSFSPTERKLNAASNPYLAFKFGLSFSADPILNAISGRTAKLKKNVALEQKQNAFVKTEAMFDRYFFENELHIPIANIDGFKFFVIEDVDYISAMQTNNIEKIQIQIQIQIQIRIRQLALRYLTLLSKK